MAHRRGCARGLAQRLRTRREQRFHGVAFLPVPTTRALSRIDAGPSARWERGGLQSSDLFERCRMLLVARGRHRELLDEIVDIHLRRRWQAALRLKLGGRQFGPLRGRRLIKELARNGPARGRAVLLVRETRTERLLPLRVSRRPLTGRNTSPHRSCLVRPRECIPTDAQEDASDLSCQPRQRAPARCAVDGYERGLELLSENGETGAALSFASGRESRGLGPARLKKARQNGANRHLRVAPRAATFRLYEGNRSLLAHEDGARVDIPSGWVCAFGDFKN